MNILIIGASGFIGSHCFDYFAPSHRVSGVDAVESVSRKITIDKGFVKTKELIAQNRFDAVINCAGSSNIQRSFIHPEQDYELNTQLVKQVLDTIRNHSPSTKLINLSSAAVYGNPTSLPIKETDSPSPLSPYGQHKLEAENSIQRYFNEEGIMGLSLRIFSAYGVGLKRQFFHDLSQKFLHAPAEAVLFGTGKESRDFIYISDICNAIECLLLNASFNGGVYNLASGHESLIEQTAREYAQVFGFKGKIVFSNEQQQGYPINWRADISKIKSTGFQPKVSINEGMELYAKWFKSNCTT